MDVFLILYLIGIVGGVILIGLGIKYNELETYGNVTFACICNIIPYIGFCMVCYILCGMCVEAKFWNKPIKKVK